MKPNEPTAQVLHAAAGILLTRGPLRALANDGWNADRLIAERRSLIIEALNRSQTLRRAVDHRLASCAAGEAAGLMNTRSLEEATETRPVEPAVEPGEPARPLQPAVQPPDAAIALQARVQLLNEEVASLRARLPSRRDRARQNRVAGELRRTQRRVDELREIVDRLTDERASLLEQVAALKLERDEALGERDQAYRSRAALEARLGDAGARAEYLRRLLPGESERLEAQLSEMPDGKGKTRLRRHLEALRSLAAGLDVAYPRTEDVLPASSEEAEIEVAVDTADKTPAAAVLEAAPVRVPTVRVGPSMNWQVLPLGGAEEIGGSALLVSVAGRRILIDAGIRPNATSTGGMAPRRINELGDRLDAIVITHAHADHAGYVPALVDRFRSAPIICSPGTTALLPTMWRDSLNVMTNRADAAAEWMSTGAPAPLYSDAELIQAEENLRTLEFGRTLRVGSELELRLFPAGHVLGAAGVVLSADGGRGGRVVVTGDISDVRQASVSEFELPQDEWIADTDLVVIESTYCHEALPRREDQVNELVAEIRDVVANRGRVLIPAFALGRAQEIALILAEHLPEVPVLIDGLARQVSDIYELTGVAEATRVNEGRRRRREERYEEAASPDLIPVEADMRPVQIFTDMVQRVPDKGRLRAIRSFDRGVVITTSGMLTGGPAVQWAREILPSRRDALFLCGYQDEEAPGRHLLTLVEQPETERQPLQLIDYRSGPFSVDVLARVRNYRLSAHADQRGLIEVIDRIAPKAVMLVHGRRDRQEHFRNVLRVRSQRSVPTRDWHAGPI